MSLRDRFIKELEKNEEVWCVSLIIIVGFRGQSNERDIWIRIC